MHFVTLTLYVTKLLCPNPGVMELSIVGKVCNFLIRCKLSQEKLIIYL